MNYDENKKSIFSLSNNNNEINFPFLIKLSRISDFYPLQKKPQIGINDNTHYTVHGVTSGEAFFSVDKKDYYLKENDIVIVHPGDIHKSIEKSSDFNFIWIEIDFTSCAEIFSGFEFQNVRYIENCLEIVDIMKDLYSFVSSKNDASEFILSSKCYNLVMNLYDVIYKRFNSNYPKSIIKAQEFIHENYLRDISINEIAEYSNVSESYLRKIFKAHLGVAPTDYIINKRIQKAVFLLKNTNLSCQTIAEETGFFDAAHLNKTFLKNLSLTPSKLRNKE